MELRSVNLEPRIVPQYNGQKKSPQMSFTGKSDYSKEIMKNLPQAKIIEKMEGLKWLKGEIGGILITALGTGLVAPVFIGFNPFVRAPKNATKEQKQDIKDTKMYTAMRQPISAVLAILFQASVQKYIDKGLDKVFNNPEYAKYARITVDQSSLNTESRVKDTIREQMKSEGKSKPSWIKALFSKEAREQRAAYTLDFKERVDNLQEKQIKNVAEIFENEGYLKPGSRELPTKSTAELVNKQIDEYIKQCEELKKTPEKINFYAKRAEVLINNENHIKEIFKQIPIEDVKTAQKAGDTEALKKLYRQVGEAVDKLIAEEKNVDVRELLLEIKDRDPDLRAHRAERTLERIDSIKKLLGLNNKKKYNPKEYKLKLLERNNVLDQKILDLTDLKIKKLESVNAANIKEILGNVAKVLDFSKEKDKNSIALLKNTDLFGDKPNELIKKVFKDVTKKYKKLVENHYKSWNQFTKIGVGVFITLPITCTALNWVYPRFMEIFFPKLAGVKKKQADKNIQNPSQNKVGGGK